MKKVFKYCFRIIIFLFLFSILQVVLLKFIPAYFTPLMIIRKFDGKIDKDLPISHKWVPLEEISKKMPLAVIASEDNLFMEHNGFDFDQIKKSRAKAEKAGKSLKEVKGTSTISQQTAKNIFLWHGRSFVRKGLEAYYTILIELIWGKKRIMEIYLNSIEMGRGIYGVEAVAKSHFKKSAKNLTASESALIATTLPNPILFNSAKPSSYMQRRKSKIQSLMNKIQVPNFEKKSKSDSKLKEKKQQPKSSSKNK